MRLKARLFRAAFVFLITAVIAQTPKLFAASHREAPITALDQKADITDWFTFVSPEHPDKVVMILNVDPFLEPSNGPNYFPFDPGILYEMKVDNNNDGDRRHHLPVSLRNRHSSAGSVHRICWQSGWDSSDYGA